MQTRELLTNRLITTIEIAKAIVRDFKSEMFCDM